MNYRHLFPNFRCRRWAGLGTAVLLMSLLAASGTSARADDASAKAKLFDKDGNAVGRVMFVQKPDDLVEVRVEVTNLSPDQQGFHGFHIHGVGVCDPTGPKPFDSAGAHFDLDGHSHPHHTGDMPVLLVNAEGTGKARFRTDRFSVADLFDANGSAVIVHEVEDNYANIPVDRYAPPPDATTLRTGDAGARIACGVIERGEDD